MVSGINAAASGMIAQQMNMDIISNNLANINTPGFKELIPVFKNVNNFDLKEKNSENFGNSDKKIGSLSTGSTLDATVLNFNQGALSKTENKLDFALNGEGFFVVQSQNGDCYTRNGSFSVNNEGVLVTKDGNAVLNKDGAAIKLDLSKDNIDKLNVRSDGTIFVNKKEVDKLKIVTFDNPSGLITAGNALYKPINESVKPKEANNCVVEQGYVEGSNSSAIGSMISTISASRAYESLSRVLKQTEMTLQKAVTDVGRVKE